MVKILLIEDENDLREIISEMLEAENYEIMEAVNGKEGLELAWANLPDLIICDVMMPEMDGYQVLNQLRQRQETETTPFIFITAKASRSDQRQGMDLGADDYLTKPFTRKELLKAVSTRLDKKKTVEKHSQKNLEELRTNLTRSLPHELRTPLNGIISSADLIKEYVETMEAAEIKEIAEMIKISGRRLYNLIQKFLLYSKLELVATMPEKLEGFLAGITESTEMIITHVTQKKSIEYRRESDVKLQLIDSQLPIAENWFIIIVDELVDNAFKYSEKGSLLIVSSIIKENQWLLSITDHGRGMTTEEINSIGAYMQFGRQMYEQQGAGLGLSICKRLVELYDGNLTINSVPAKKTTVCLTFILLGTSK